MHDAMADAAAIFRAGLARVDSLAMMERVLSLSGDTLVVATETARLRYDLSGYRRIIALGAGKAAARMALGLEQVLGDRLWGGCVAVKEGYTEHLSRLTLLEAGHPVPDARSLRAARALLDLAAQAGPDDLVIVLLSGGGSAILAAPLETSDRRLTLADKQAVTRELLACGASIQEINLVRKKLSAIKGGRLARAIAPASCLTLVLSDVVGDDVASIASGPTVPDPASPADALAIVAHYGLVERLPEAVLGLLRDMAEGRLDDTPKPGDPAFAACRTVLVGSNYQALLAARDAARSLGYTPLLLTSRLIGEAREAAHLFAALARDMVAHGLPTPRPGCVIAGGETTVTLRGSGKGGRNQELALAFLEDLSRNGRDIGEAVLLAAATDGGDGPTEAAGAFASRAILEQGRECGLSPSPFLAENDAYNYFRALDRLFVTGPTNTNVCDITVLVSP